MYSMMQILNDVFLPLELDTLRWWWVLLTVLVIAGSIVYAIVSYMVERTSKQPLRSKPSKKEIKKKSKEWHSIKYSLTSWFQQLFADDNKKEIISDWSEGIDHGKEVVLQEELQIDEKKEELHIAHIVEDKLIDEELYTDWALVEDWWEVDLSLEDDEILPEHKKDKLPRWKTLLTKKPKKIEDADEILDESIQDEQLEETQAVDEQRVEQEQQEQQPEVVLQEEILMTEETVDQMEQHNKTQIKREEFKSDLEYLKKKQKWDEYESKLIEGLAKDPEHMDIIEHLADFYMMDNQQKKALPLYKKLVEKQPEHHIFLRKMAQVYMMMKDLEMAEVLLDRSLALHPETPKYAMNLVEIYYKTNRKDMSLSLMEDIIKRRPENLSYRSALINLYEEFGYDEKVIDAYESMLLVDPTNITLKRKLLEARTKIS